MLKKSRLLFMDEATASVDSHTDGVIQRIIREDFASCTIISIAHRIPTVMDCDRVLVMDAGSFPLIHKHLSFLSCTYSHVRFFPVSSRYRAGEGVRQTVSTAREAVALRGVGAGVRQSIVGTVRRKRKLQL